MYTQVDLFGEVFLLFQKTGENFEYLYVHFIWHSFDQFAICDKSDLIYSDVMSQLAKSLYFDFIAYVYIASQPFWQVYCIHKISKKSNQGQILGAPDTVYFFIRM